MATFVATTASNSPKLKDPEATQKVLDRYLWDCDIVAVIEKDGPEGPAFLNVYGYDWPSVWKIPDGIERTNFEPDYINDPGEGFEDFRKDIAPFLAEPFTIQAIGAEKCRFPLAACEWRIKPGANTIEVTSFNHSDSQIAPDEIIKTSV